MYAGNLQAIDRLDLRNDPVSFKQYAERIRNHFFDLSRIGETVNPNLIEKVCQRLQPLDRLDWNAGRRGDMETRTLTSFGTWLCERAAAYQNAYSLAAEQQQAANKPGVRFNARANKIYSRPVNNASSKPARKPFCFKCDCGGDHRLKDCRDFKALPVVDRIAFSSKPRLCFGCLKAKHSVYYCSIIPINCTSFT